jgi:tRNA-specific 2-thiouridylase
MKNIKVAIGLSGGVDSSVAAYLLKEEGYEVLGVTMQFDDNCAPTAADDAQRVAAFLDIPHYVMDFRREFKEHVIDYFVNEYQNGRTPNPCIVCNRYVKLRQLLHADIGADFVATGHYARVCRLENGRYALRKSVDTRKDQSYVLYKLSQSQLSRIRMPLGEYTKDEIREIATKLDLPVANKKDSQEICFIPDNDYAGFIRNYSGDTFPPGNYVNLNGEILGQHKGIIHYTVGQRKGLNLAMGHPVFVKEIRSETNEVVIANHEYLFSSSFFCNNINFMAYEIPPENLIVKVRYAHTGTPCTVTLLPDGSVECILDEPVRAITPGQSAVFYYGDVVCFGGTIL